MSWSWPSWLSTPRDRHRALLVLVMVIGVFLAMRAAWAALVPFFLGAFLGYLLVPLVNFLDHHAPQVLHRLRLARPLSIIIVYLVVIGVIAGLLTVFIPTIVEQGAYLIQMAPTFIARLDALANDDLTAFLDRIPPQIRDTVDEAIHRASTAILDAVEVGLGATVRTLFETVSFLLGLILVPFWLFYVLNDQENVVQAFYSIIPKAAREDVRCVLVVIDRVLSAYLRGQAVVCIIVGIMSVIVLVIFDIRGALLLGTIAAILEVVPNIGPVLAAIPPILIALGQGPMRALWLALAFVGIQQIENNFLSPRIRGAAVHWHPAAVMVFVVMGAELAGVWGVIFAVPFAAVVRDVFLYLYLRTTERGATPEMALETLRLTSM